mmetsp:Transcript_40805/g.75520  ORF Transcript_40805/g.75520 Transcript_40805/m.75520 type:complete len:223 (-) Transcript_40805:247-915(-)|eukprot:CAMPEP_0197454924 /NCGR_PEP_ID=MMETSP1175-20131217/39380_1 /TAXON_ID=1003142 /ORGANISM="Triceratium dubium, Strain CCMP147" /LENGTH=222 /DNA_ID=CAMNT_0042988641 /DNA_START=147 /DNA_END=815 /DNA_ORIENTATION=+
MTTPNSAVLPKAVTVTIANKTPCGFEVGRSVSSIGGNPAGVRIVSLDSSFRFDSGGETSPRIGDEIILINGQDPKNSPDVAKKILSEAKGDEVPMVVLRSQTLDYRRALVARRFGKDYTVDFRSSTHAELKPVDNPSVLLAAIAPMFKTRFKYIIAFDDATGAVTFEDAYALNFNRANGATPEQQERIQSRHREFKDRLEKMEAEMENNYEEARKLALAENK